jgi:ribosomal protein S1
MENKKINAEEKALYSQMEEFLSNDSNKLKTLSKGDIVEGKVVDIREGIVVVDVGYKSEGIVAGRELKSDSLDWTH